ncbi:amino acid adenylation domain-containing protein [Marinibactrum halimedae]|uniref:AMP-dependent synthetase/ligase domain-containing protein n=1 Tax=Marinibactrum halimedae TaxID=1444977 RepID=A0AA37T855_9GAMM|nr:amino acid adenylation domain-containing protein [Marinibactrum halimedae]MCD9458510.1 amino acid adenylation domain-containing protein [Marinibactrum halimedae]GLS26627.1 hypothetical protein GCM10007877_23430 [Marinibactrum halimedae]
MSDPALFTYEKHTDKNHIAFGHIDSFNHLSTHDKYLFKKFAAGPICELPTTCIHHAFEFYARTTPNAIAAIHKKDTITYGELNRRADLLATYLATQGIGPGDYVGLFVRRSIPMLIGIMAVLKIGAAYVPQDVKLAPENQLRYIIDKAKISVILTLSAYHSKIKHFENTKTLCIDKVNHSTTNPLATKIITGNITGKTNSKDPCFILFTSGTTGKPNGVKVTHENVCNILLTEPGDLGMKPGMKVSQLLNIAFDMAAWEILGCLSHGATLLIRESNMQAVANDADVIIATPSILHNIDPEQCTHVKTVAVAGEPCSKPLADKWSQKCAFYNCCGPTETTIVNTAQHYTGTGEPLTIGKPTPNNTIYILNADQFPCKIGEIGEIWAGGKGISAGYLNNPTLTNERYAPDPFLNDGMMFRTRDLARWTKDGELEFFGRADDQVKFKGFRIELDGISSVIESTPNCTQATTLKYNSHQLVAFITPSNVDCQQVRKTLEKNLPYYCIPEHIYTMETLPLTDRGKVDKRKLRSFAEKLQRVSTLSPTPSEELI